MFLPGWWRNPKSCHVARLRPFAGRGPVMAWRFPTSPCGNWHFFSLGGFSVRTERWRTQFRGFCLALESISAQLQQSYPKDPVDRLIGATARAEGLALVTRDEMIRNSPLLKTIW